MKCPEVRAHSGANHALNGGRGSALKDEFGVAGLLVDELQCPGYGLDLVLYLVAQYNSQAPKRGRGQAECGDQVPQVGQVPDEGGRILAMV